MSGRLRKPSAKVLEIASMHAAPAPGPKKRKSKTAPAPKKTKVAKEEPSKRARLTNVDAGVQEQDGPGASAGQAYCICLGQDDGTPMIQCEGCDNWFHFRCIQLDPAEAAKIQAFFCEICTEVGAGVTQKREDGPEDVVSDGAGVDDSDARISNGSGSEGDFVIHNDDFKAKRPKTQPKSKSRRKKAEGFESSTDEDEDYPGQGDPEVEPAHRERERRPRERRPAKARRKASGQGTALAEQANATRQQCIASLSKSLEGILAADPETASRSTQLATDIESVVFNSHNEDGFPRTKYLAQFRTLLFNLKSNDAFRAKIASFQLDASAIANMSREDLMSAEHKAMAESIRAKSLKESVKVIEAAPRIRRTHKGEEVVDEYATIDTSVEYRPAEDVLKDHSLEGANPRSPGPASASSPRSPSAPFAEGQRSFSPPVEIFKRPLPAKQPVTAVQLNEEDLNLPATTLRADTPPEVDMEEGTPEPGDRPKDAPVSAPNDASVDPTPTTDEPAKGSQFDFDSLWTSFKSPTTPKAPQGPDSKEETEGGAAADDDYDPFALKSTSRKDDMDLDQLLHPEIQIQRSTTPESTPPPQVPTLGRSALIRGFQPVWNGDVLMPEEGGYPAIGVQVGGRNLGVSPQVWQSVLPSALNIDGRIPTKAASDYLVQCSFANTRELIVIALLPDKSGPSPDAPHKPAAEKSEAKHEHLVSYFTGRSRNGVCPPTGPLKKVVKDIYIIPLQAKDALPEYIELLDSHALGETGERDANLLLAVLVLQKGAIPTAHAPPYTPAAASQATSALPAAVPQAAKPTAATPLAYTPPHATSTPIASHPIPVPSYQSPLHSYQPPPAAAPMPMPALDTNALQSLMAQPDVLASLLASTSQHLPQPDPNAGLLQNLGANPNLMGSLLPQQPQQHPYPAYGQPYDQDRRDMRPQDRYPPRRRSRSPPPFRRDDRDRRGGGRGNYTRDSGWGSRNGGR